MIKKIYEEEPQKARSKRKMCKPNSNSEKVTEKDRKNFSEACEGIYEKLISLSGTGDKNLVFSPAATL